MVDADREKISKSKQGQGGYEKPQTSEAYVKKCGADVVRLWVASQDFRNDIIVSEERISKVAETYRVPPQRPALPALEPLRLRPGEAHGARRPADRAGPLDSGRVLAVGAGSHRGLRPVRVPRRVPEGQPVRRRRAVGHLSRRGQGPALHRPGEFAPPPLDPDRAAPDGAGLCKMLAPILAFTADEAWEFVPGKTVDSAHQLTWQPGVHIGRTESGHMGLAKAVCASWRCRSWRRPARPKQSARRWRRNSHSPAPAPP